MMKMQEVNVLVSGGSDTRARQGGLIVPGSSRSGRNAEFHDGLPAARAAGAAGERAPAGIVSACPAGALTLNTPAKGDPQGKMLLGNQDALGVTMHPLRLRGGGGGDDSSNDEDPRPQTDEEELNNGYTQQERGEKNMGLVDHEPGPSGAIRSRSPLETQKRDRTNAKKNDRTLRTRHTRSSVRRMVSSSSLDEYDDGG